MAVMVGWPFREYTSDDLRASLCTSGSFIV